MVESSKKTIVVLIRQLPDKSGGVQKGVFQLYAALRDKGFVIEFILDSDDHETIIYDGFKVHKVKFPPVYNYLFSKKYFQNIQLKKQIISLFESEYLKRKFVLVAHWAPDFLLLSYLGHKYNVKTVFSFHGPYHTRKFMQLFNRKQFWLKSQKNKLTGIDKFVFISRTLYSDMIDSGCIIKSKALTIINGIYIKPTVEDVNNDVIKFVVVSRLVKNKNIDEVILALNLFKKRGVDFICDIFGDGEQEHNLRILIGETGLEKHVFLKGFSPQIDESLYMYDLFISASLFEGMPRSPLEAINNNVIPILSDIPTHREILPDNLNLFFDLNTTNSLVSKIDEIINLSKIDKEIIKNCLRENLISKYDVNFRFKKFQELFESLMKEV
jgi:glycosyltransferase involved in cell wall biosynthesis